MLLLYVKTGCPYSARVRDFAHKMGIMMEERYIDTNETHHKELMARGGKEETPFLLDTERGIGMYESEDIVKYLNDNYGIDHVEKSSTDLRI